MTAKEDRSGSDAEQQGATEPNEVRDSIAAEITRVSAIVPEIGEGWRWYDIPYRAGSWMLEGRTGRLLGASGRSKVNRLTNLLIPFNEVQRERHESVDSPVHNLLIDPDEQVRQAGVWVTEIFPPSRYGALQRSMKRLGWDPDGLYSLDHKSAEDAVAEARRGSGFFGMQVGLFVDPTSGQPPFGATRLRLPTEFSAVEISTMQVGSSLTAVTAFFRLSESGQRALDDTLHSDHEPRLVLRGFNRPSVLSRRSAAIRATQETRQALHDHAREWFKDRCSGYFADQPSGAPVTDLTVFRKYDPRGDEPLRTSSNALEALGLGELEIFGLQTSSLPGYLITPSPERPRFGAQALNCYGVVGQMGRARQENTRPGSGPNLDSPSSIATAANRRIRPLLVLFAVEHYLGLLESSRATARDSAPTAHRKYRLNRLRSLRKELLKDGVDLPPLARDVLVVTSKSWRKGMGLDLRTAPTRRSQSTTDEDVLDFTRKRHKARIRQLLRADADYRQTLSTVSALGSSIESSRTSRAALFVSLGTLAVTVLVLLGTPDGLSNGWSLIANFWTGIW